MGYHTKTDFATETIKQQTRAERRRDKKQQEKDMQLVANRNVLERSNLYTFTEQQLREFITVERQMALQEVHKEWGKNVCKVFLPAMRIVLHDRYQFGEKRLNDVCYMIEQQLDCILEKCVTAEEMEQAARDLNDRAIYKR